MIQIHPRRIIGSWHTGFALDIHTTSSIPLGHNEYGHMQFDTTYSPVGDLMFRLKSRSDQSTVPAIVTAATAFLQTWNPPVEIIIPVPPSNRRVRQPVLLLAQAIAGETGIPLANCVTKARGAPPLKNIFDLDERLQALQGVHLVDPNTVRGKRVLLFDDLFRSGATMNTVTTALFDQGKAADGYALTITRTRSHQ